MSDLRIKANIDCGDLPKDFDGQETKLEPITLGKFKIELKDVFNPTPREKPSFSIGTMVKGILPSIFWGNHSLSGQSSEPQSETTSSSSSLISSEIANIESMQRGNSLSL